LSGWAGIQCHSFEEASPRVVRTPQPTQRPRISLDARVQRFVDELVRNYADRIEQRPKAFKSRVLALFSLRLPPYPRPSGRPQQLRITRAAEMYANQQREVTLGTRKQISWSPIAQRCIAGLGKIRSNYVRRIEIDRLRDAVYARRRKRNRSHRPETAERGV